MSHRPYLPVEPSLVDHPKTKRLAKIWGCHPYTVVGFLLKLWGYCLEFQDDGSVDGRPADVLDEFAAPCHARTIGTMPTVREALLTAGFIDEDGRLHDWEEYAGALIERRRKDRRRKQLARRQGGAERRRMSSGHPADRRGKSARRVEKSRVEKSRVDLTKQQPPLDYKTRCVVSVNHVLDRQLAGAFTALTVTEHGPIAEGWESAGIPIELVEKVLAERTAAFRSNQHNRQPHTLRYFDNAVREAWSKSQASTGKASGEHSGAAFREATPT